MKTPTRLTIVVTVALVAVMAAHSAGAQSEPSMKRTGKTFIVDPRVQGEALLIGGDPAKLDYAELLSVLQVHGFAVVARGDVVRVIPEATIRQQPVAIVVGKEAHPDAEYVTKTFTLKNVPAAQLVPILRPLLPQQ